MSRMRWDKAAREKLKKEAALYEQSAFFTIKFGLTTRVQEVAYANILIVLDELEDILELSYSVVKDYDELIIEKRSRVEKELIYISDNSYDIEIKQAFQEFLLHFKQGDLKKYDVKSSIEASNSPGIRKRSEVKNVGGNSLSQKVNADNGVPAKHLFNLLMLVLHNQKDTRYSLDFYSDFLMSLTISIGMIIKVTIC